MRNLLNLSVIIYMMVAFKVSAQSPPVAILQKTIDKIHTLKNVSYEVKRVQKNPFSEGDITTSNTKATLVFTDNGLLKAKNELIDINNRQTSLREAYLDDMLYNIELKNRLYSVDKNPKNVGSDLSTFIDLIKYYLDKKPSKIIQRPDTLINHISCYNIFIRGYDTIENNAHNYTYVYLFINKTTLMPVYTKEDGAGMFYKEGHPLGRLHNFDEVYFSNFQLNKKIDAAIFYFNRSGFELQNDKMLADGTLAPELKVKDLSYKNMSPSLFKNKVLLVEFGSTTCGANPLANPMLNRLNKKYDTNQFAVVSVYSDETPDQIKKYIETNKLQFPIYLGNSKLKRSFKTMGTPGFYLIDKNGKVVQSSDGYSDGLEKQLSAQIDKLK